MKLSRRRFAQLTGTAVIGGGPLAGQSGPVTADQIVARIQKSIGVPWQGNTSDTLKAGDPNTSVTGIATTAMATMDVLSRAVKQKANLIITAEPTFFSHLDGQAPPAGRRGGFSFGPPALTPEDPILVAKKDYIEKNGLVVFRLLEHWQARKPNAFAEGLGRTLGWSKHQLGDDPARYEIPSITLGALVDHLAKQLKSHAGIRVIGDPQSRVRRITLLPGDTPEMPTVEALPNCDVVIGGEVREWEAVEYAQDTVTAGEKKGFILVGRVQSLDPGMDVCADWLKKIVPEVPASWIPTGDPYWRPV